MNYKILPLIFLAYHFIISNVWADCCFIKPSKDDPIPMPTDPIPASSNRCTTTTDFDECNNTPDRVGYLNNNAYCATDGFTCCVKGESGFIIEGKRELKVVDASRCRPDEKAQVLPLTVYEFTAVLEDQEDNKYISLSGIVTDLKGVAYLDIWRAQIEGSGNNAKVTNLTMIDSPILNEEDIEKSYAEFPFNATDTNPLNGTNYYVLAERNMNGEYTAHCKYIQHITIGEGIPDPLSAEQLCQQHMIIPLLHIFTY